MVSVDDGGDAVGVETTERATKQNKQNISQPQTSTTKSRTLVCRIMEKCEFP